MLLPHCEVAQRLASRIDLPTGVAAALGAAYARWDGKGVPSGIGSEGIPRSIRVAVVARDLVLAAGFDRDRVEHWMLSRRGRALDPVVVDAALSAGATELVDDTGSTDVWEKVLDAEPGMHRMLSGDKVREACEALGDFADLKVGETAGHSRSVKSLATTAAESLGVGSERTHRLGLAALVHDLGRVGVSNTVWSHPGPLSAGQWEQVRLHAYYTERILSRVSGLEEIARLAGSDHERPDGSGYHRGSDEVDTEVLVLAAADRFQAMSQPRRYRPALTPGAIVDELRTSIRNGALGRRETEAVIGAAMGRADEVNVERPAGLTEREVDVLRLIARGHTNKQAARTLGISPKTVGTHVEHVYAKAGVSTRAAVTLFAIENDLIE